MDKLKQIKVEIMIVLAIARFNYETLEEFKEAEPSLFDLVNRIQNILNED